MSANPPTSPSADKLTAELAREMFGRSRASAAMGTFGVSVVMATHWEVLPWPAAGYWFAAALATFVVRIVFAHQVLRRLAAAVRLDALVNAEAALSGLSAIAWASCLYVFDTGSQDHLYYLRLMILAAALAFTTGSLSVFMRVFCAYAAGLFLPLLYYLGTAPYVTHAATLVGGGLAYLGMISIVAFSNNRRFRAGTRSHIEVLALSEQLQRLLDTERSLREEMGRLARTDDLTGLANRRAVVDQLGRELSRCLRFGLPLAVVSMDIDHFKVINDTHGHAAGDAALRALGRMLRATLREADFSGRMGGEEFLIGLPHLEEEGAVAAAERVRQRLAELDIPVEGGNLRITASFGVAAFRSGDTPERILSRADEALYAAKRKGRNRCETAPAPED